MPLVLQAILKFTPKKVVNLTALPYSSAISKQNFSASFPSVICFQCPKSAEGEGGPGILARGDSAKSFLTPYTTPITIAAVAIWTESDHEAAALKREGDVPFMEEYKDRYA
jgi:hypothetical protein